MTSDRNGGYTNSERPAMSGRLGQDYEEPISGGGSGPKGFVPSSEVRDVFSRGLELLKERLTATADEHHIEAAIARVRLRPRAIAKSHRHPVLFDRLQVAGVQRPGNILALITQRSLTGLAELVQHATQTQLLQLSAVAEVTPYEAPIERGEPRSVVTLFDGSLDDGSSLRSRGLEDLNRRGLQLKPYGKTRDAYTSSSLPPDETLRHMPWLRRVRPVMRFRSATQLGPHPIRPLNVLPSSQPLPLPIVGVIDSGIDSSIPWLQRLVVAQENHIPPKFADLSHGSLVGALAATGGGFTLDPNHFPSSLARLLDIQVLGSGDCDRIDEDDLVTLVEDAVERYGPRATPLPDAVDEPVLIWNISLAGTSAASEEMFSQVAVELDRIAQENGVIFTVAAGNYTQPPLRGWVPGHGPEKIANGEDRIASPADAALGISVGSLSDTSNSPTASPSDHPSPFSRRGPGPGMLVKPDVVHYGGTCARNGQPVGGIRGPYRNGTPLEDIGTSFAAPRVAAQLAQLVGVLPEPEPELLKLLLLLSCTSRGDHDTDRRESVNYYGFGVPETPVAILSCNLWECTVLLRGEIRPGRTLQIPFPFPPSLEDNQRRRGYVRMALVYTPVLDSSKGSEYCQTNVIASLGRRFDYPVGNPKRYKREILPLPQKRGIGAQHEKDLIEHGWKWSPTKVYERTFTRMEIHPKEIGWRLSLDLLLRRELEDSLAEVRQPFWLGIRIADPEQRNPVYQDMRQQIQSMALAQPIALRPQIIV